MIYNVKGTLTYTDPTFAVVECGGVGFKCFVSMTTLKELPSIGNEVNLYTYMAVREDALDLFGFYEADELDAFKLLISVSGIGPKAAISVLSYMSPESKEWVYLPQMELQNSSGNVVSWNAQSLLNLNIGPDTEQVLLGNQTVKFQLSTSDTFSEPGF